MTREEARLTLQDNFGYLSQEHPRILEALRVALDALSQPSIPSNLDEVTMDFARELDFFLYGSYAPERFPNSMQVRDGHSGLRVNDWKCWVNRPELKIEMVKHFFTIGKQAGAEWMDRQGETIEGEILTTSDYGWETIRIPKKLYPLGTKVTIQIRKKQ